MNFSIVRRVAALIALTSLACSDAKPKPSQVSLDVSALYRRDALGVIATTRVQFSELRLYLLGGSQQTTATAPVATVTRSTSTTTTTTSGTTGTTTGTSPDSNTGTGDFGATIAPSDGAPLVFTHLQPDPTTMSIELIVPSGAAREVVLMAGEQNDATGGMNRVDYMGFGGAVELPAGGDAETRLATYPAGVAEVHLDLPSGFLDALAAKNITPPPSFGCEVVFAPRQTPSEIPVIHKWIAFEGFESPRGDFTNGEFGDRIMPLPAGDYIYSCRLSGQNGDLVLDPQPLHVDQSNKTTVKSGVHFAPATSSTTTTPLPSVRLRAGLIANTMKADDNYSADDFPMLTVEAIDATGSVMPSYTGRVHVTLSTINFSGSRFTLNKSTSVGISDPPFNGAAETSVDFTSSDMGRKKFMLMTSMQVPTMVLAEAYDEADTHNRAMVAYTITNTAACSPSGIGNSPLVLALVENARLPIHQQPDGTYQGLAQHMLMVATSLDLNGDRCVEPSLGTITISAAFSRNASARLPGPSVDFLAPADPGSTPYWSNISPSAAYDTADVTGTYFARGQAYLYNAVRGRPDALDAAMSPATITARGGIYVAGVGSFTCDGDVQLQADLIITP